MMANFSRNTLEYGSPTRCWALLTPLLRTPYIYCNFWTSPFHPTLLLKQMISYNQAIEEIDNWFQNNRAREPICWKAEKSNFRQSISIQRTVWVTSNFLLGIRWSRVNYKAPIGQNHCQSGGEWVRLNTIFTSKGILLNKLNNSEIKMSTFKIEEVVLINQTAHSPKGSK